jgi:hypothetical protein
MNLRRRFTDIDQDKVCLWLTVIVFAVAVAL